MKVEELSAEIIAFELQRERQMDGEIQVVLDVIAERPDCDVILDFTSVDIITSASLSKLLMLRQKPLVRGRHVVLCCVNPFTRGAFYDYRVRRSL